jgi:hypothetical protein
MEQTKLILETIREACSTSREVKGSVLGAILKARFPLLNLREVYGGLRKFIAAECANLLRFSHKQGGDDVFTVIDCREMPFASDPSTIWRLFGNPNETGRLYYDVAIATILLGSEDFREDYEGLAPIPRITHEEQKLLIREFAVNAFSGDELSLIEKTLDSVNYWQLASGIFRSSRPSRISDFVEFRKSRLLEILRQRLVAAGASEPQAQATCTWVEEKQRSTSLTSELSHVKGPDRRVILDLVARMSDEELDQLTLPIRMVADMVSRLAR